MLFIIAVTFSVLLNGFAFSILWNWFVVPSLGVNELTVSYSCGIYLLINYVTTKADIVRSKDTTEIFIIGFITPIMSIVVGWAILQFI